MAGLRVVRGPDWKYGDQDGGVGHVGFVKECGEDNVTVIWDNGERGTYRKGVDGPYDLRVLDNGPAVVKHKSVQCDGCQQKIIYGMRWKCAVCADYDLCTECYGDNKHDMTHNFKRFDTPTSQCVVLEARSGMAICQAKGVYKGAEVTRGDGWCDGNQDGGGDSLGSVMKLEYKIETGSHIAGVYVKWPHADHAFPYSLGWKGRIDLKYLIYADGWKYYPEHLPLLGDEKAVICSACESDDESDSDDDSDDEDMAKIIAAMVASKHSQDGLPEEIKRKIAKAVIETMEDKKSNAKKTTQRRFTNGDLVFIKRTETELKELQDGHGEWDNAMRLAIGTVGIIRDIDKSGDAKVCFGANTWNINPAAIKSISIDDLDMQPKTLTQSGADDGREMDVGTIVRLCDEASEVERLQHDHGGWADKMRNFLGRLGIVKHFDDDGDVQVCLGKEVWTFNRDALVPEQVIIPNLLNADGDGDGAESLEQGQIVCFIDDIDKVRRLQHAHGGWNDQMTQYIGRCGIVQRVDDDGDGHVVFGAKKWFINPALVTILEDTSDDELGAVTVNSKGRLEKNINIGKSLKNGDLVRLEKNEQVARQQQKKHGGWVNDMKRYLGKRGIVENVRITQMQVCFGEDSYWYNPALMTKLKRQNKQLNLQAQKQLEQQKEVTRGCAERLGIGDIVQLWRNIDTVKSQQQGHGGWNRDMEKEIGKLGMVTKIDAEFDIRVCFGENIWCINPALLSLQAHSGDSVGTRAPKSCNLDLFKSGKFVKLNENVDDVQTLQVKHGDWSNTMYSNLGTIGIVCKKIKEGVISVNFGTNKWHLNKAALTPWVIPVVQSGYVSPPESRDPDETSGYGDVSDTSSVDDDQSKPPYYNQSDGNISSNTEKTRLPVTRNTTMNENDEACAYPAYGNSASYIPAGYAIPAGTQHQPTVQQKLSPLQVLESYGYTPNDVIEMIPDLSRGTVGLGPGYPQMPYQQSHQPSYYQPHYHRRIPEPVYNFYEPRPIDQTGARSKEPSITGKPKSKHSKDGSYKGQSSKINIDHGSKSNGNNPASSRHGDIQSDTTSLSLSLHSDPQSGASRGNDSGINNPSTSSRS